MPRGIRCPRCHTVNDGDHETCYYCGEPLRPPEPASAEAIAPHLSEEDRQRIIEEERLRAHLRGQPATPGRAPVAGEAHGNMGRAAVLGLLLGLIGLAIGLVYNVAPDPDKRVFGKQLMAWSVAGMLVLFVLLMYLPSAVPPPPALQECAICGGTGTVDCPVCVNGYTNNPITHAQEVCTFCNGQGRTICTFCNGTGKRQ